MAEPNGRRTNGVVAQQKAIWWVMSGMVGALGWMVVQIVAIQSNRFTAADGKEVWQEISEIRREMAFKANINEVPPPEVLRWLQRHDRDIEKLKGP